ncbi:MAG: hypothetical protein IJG60_09175 [Thermoguttaceae bacterium]|nr:hypothetical protein [Thermoguttaceae bacterium]
MSIHVICPGCMTQFEVSDRFAGKKGPCPKCGHIIEIPKANVTIVSPDEMVVDGKKVHNPDHVRPIEQKSYSFTGHALLVNLGVFAAVLAVALFFHFVHMPYLAVPVGILLGLAVAFPLMKYGYMTFRDPDDLEIFLGGELGKKSIAGAAVFVALWLVYELILLYMNPGGMALVYLIPIALFAAFVPVVIFDMDFTDSLAVAVVFLLAVILLRGLMFNAEGGWIWQRHEMRRAVPAAVSGPGERSAGEGEEAAPAAGDDADSGQSEDAAPAARRPARRPKLDANAPDPTAVRRRR